MAPERSPPLLTPRLVRLDDLPAAAPTTTDPQPYKDELARLYLWQRALEDRQATLDRRAQEIDDRFGQVIADTKELEEQVRRAAAEEARFRAEGDRLDRFRGELDARQASLADAA